MRRRVEDEAGAVAERGGGAEAGGEQRGERREELEGPERPGADDDLRRELLRLWGRPVERGSSRGRGRRGGRCLGGRGGRSRSLSFAAATSAASAAIDLRVKTCGPPTGISRTSSEEEEAEEEELEEEVMAVASISSRTSLATSRPSTGLILVPPSPVRTTSFLLPVSRGSRSHELMSRK